MRHRRTSRLGRDLATAGILLVILVLMLAAAAVFYWHHAVPRRTLIRNAEMTTAREISSLLELENGVAYADLGRKTKAADYGGHKWLKQLKLNYAYPATAVLTPVERKPLLSVNANGSGYWLCDDGALVDHGVEDSGGVFELIAMLPGIRLHHDPGESVADWAAPVCQAAACIQETMPGQIETVEVKDDGSLVLYDSKGLPIRLGQPDHLPEKIGALPKALRLCEQNRSELEYLDARNPQVFYENWKTTIE